MVFFKLQSAVILDLALTFTNRCFNVTSMIRLIRDLFYFLEVFRGSSWKFKFLLSRSGSTGFRMVILYGQVGKLWEPLIEFQILSEISIEIWGKMNDGLTPHLPDEWTITHIVMTEPFNVKDQEPPVTLQCQ